jgi:hypothetical protein
MRLPVHPRNPVFVMELRGFSNPITVRVALECPDGECWLTVGGGATLEEALRSALRSAPAQKRWRVVGWNEHSGGLRRLSD